MLVSVHAASSSSADADALGMTGHARPVSIHDLAKYKAEGHKFVMLTAYDFLSAQILDEAGIPIILVGDSLGMVMLGYDSTIPVTLDEMLHHTAAVARGAGNALVVGDMPFGTYQESPAQALASATRFLKEAGANAVKLEGGGPMIETVNFLTNAGIPVMGHLGLTPQSVNQFGGYRVQGRTEDAVEQMVADAKGLQEAGAFSIVLEAVPSDAGRRVTKAVDVPTIGIGAGPDTDGQVLVWHDLLGLTSGRLPRFVKQYVGLREHISDAVKSFAAEVRDAEYPAIEHRYE